MNNQIIIDMIKTLLSHLTVNERQDLYEALEVISRYDIEAQVENVQNSGTFRVFGAIDADESDIIEEMRLHLESECFDVIDWEDAHDVAKVASTLDRSIDNYYVFEHQEDGGHLREMARMLAECDYLVDAPMYDRLQAANLSPDDTKLHELIAFQGHMVLPMVERYLEDPTGSDEWKRDFRKALDHFWSGQGSEFHAEKVKFVMQWLADQV